MVAWSIIPRLRVFYQGDFIGAEFTVETHALGGGCPGAGFGGRVGSGTGRPGAPCSGGYWCPAPRRWVRASANARGGLFGGDGAETKKPPRCGAVPGARRGHPL